MSSVCTGRKATESKRLKGCRGTEIEEKTQKVYSLINRRQSRDRRHIWTFNDILAGQTDWLKSGLSERFQKHFVVFVSSLTKALMAGVLPHHLKCWGKFLFT